MSARKLRGPFAAAHFGMVGVALFFAVAGNWWPLLIWGVAAAIILAVAEEVPSAR